MNLSFPTLLSILLIGLGIILLISAITPVATGMGIACLLVGGGYLLFTWFKKSATKR